MYLPPPSDEFHTCHFRGNPQRKMRFMGTLRSLPRTNSTRALSRKSWDEGSRLLHASSLSYILMREARGKALDMSAARLALLSTRVTQWDQVVWIYHLRLAGCLLFGIQLPIWLSTVYFCPLRTKQKHKVTHSRSLCSVKLYLLYRVRQRNASQEMERN